MNLLVIGGGGREHAIVRKLKENPEVETIYCLPGNGGIAADAVCVADIGAKDIPAQVAFAKSHDIDFAVVAPDDPLVLGAVDALEAAGIPCFGPEAKAAIIEGSKVFSKDLMKKYGIPTAEYQVFTDAGDAMDYVKTCPLPVVVKADGLALGKGVLIAEDRAAAIAAVETIMLDRAFGNSGSQVVIEEFLTGPEVSVLAFTDGKTVVPISVRLGSDFDTLIITGPNTGGKTVTLKTIGLLTLMAECGLHIPADDGSAINVYEQVFADIGDEQSIEQSLSTFSSHTKNIVEILKVCDKDSLVLFDELCAGTDPAEGAALAISIIEFCRKCGAGVAATTHYAELKLYAMRTSGVMNASCEFNVETLQPTYRLLIGVPGKSNAFAISKRLGIDEAILEQARSLVSQNDVNFEDVLTQLDQQRQEMEKAKEEAERLRRETEKQKEKSDEYYAQIKQEKEKAAQQARKEAQYIIDDARRAADAVYEELKQLRKQAKNGAFVPGSNEKQAQMRRSLNEAESRMQPQREEKQRPEPTRAIRVGDTVELLKLGTKASVLAINKDGSYQLRAGIMQITAKPEEVYLLENETQNAAKKVIAGKVRELKAAAQPELDIRGMAVDEALPVLDNFLDAAYMGNLPNARIIHGKGTGVLRAAVQEELRRCKYVKSFRLGVYGEGESGVTIVEFK